MNSDLRSNLKSSIIKKGDGSQIGKSKSVKKSKSSVKKDIHQIVE